MLGRSLIMWQYRRPSRASFAVFQQLVVPSSSSCASSWTANERRELFPVSSGDETTRAAAACCTAGVAFRATRVIREQKKPLTAAAGTEDPSQKKPVLASASTTAATTTTAIGGGCVEHAPCSTDIPPVKHNHFDKATETVVETRLPGAAPPQSAKQKVSDAADQPPTTPKPQQQKEADNKKVDSAVAPLSSNAVNTMRVLRTVASMLWPKGNWRLKACVVGSISFMLIAKTTRVAVPFWFRNVIDILANGTTAATATATVGPFTLGVFGLLTAYGITRVTSSLTDEMKGALFAPVGANATTHIALDLFRKVHALDLKFHLEKQTGVLSKDMDRGSRAFWSLAYALIFMMIPTVFEMTLVCGALNAQAGPMFVTTAVVAVVAYVGWTYVVTNWRAKYRDRYNAADSRVGGLIVDSLLNYETVKYFSREDHELQRIGNETKKANKDLARLDQSMAVLNFGQQLIFIAAALVSMYLSTTAVLAGAMTVGDLVLIDALLLQMYSPLSWLGMLYREVQTSTQNMSAMLKILDTQNVVGEASNAVPFVLKDGTIELQGVTYRYPVKESLDAAIRPPVLNRVSLIIPGGTTVAFVGPSGCGKSTIFRLLFRFYDPEEGRILVDGQDIATLNMRSYRTHIGVIPQDTVLFHDTVMANLRYGKLDATDEECFAAAKAASVHDSVLRLSDGYQTIVGERGLKLSGGEKQRIAIARTLLHNAPILLADEATSALDSKTEEHVMQRILHGISSSSSSSAHSTAASEERQGTTTTRKTIVLIAHRLSTIQHADRIYVLDGRGGLAESGTHAELLQRHGLYATLWEQQQQQKQAE